MWSESWVSTLAKKTPIDRLADAISDILSEYQDEVDENLGEITVRLGKAGVKALKQETRKKYPDGTGEYARGWKAKEDHGRLSTTVTIYNEHYALPHLLEHGHVIRNGTGRVYGDVQPREHIAPVEEKLVKMFEQEVVSKL